MAFLDQPTKYNLICIILLAGEYEDEPECGRPVSMRMSKDGQLYVIDAYHGLFRVNILTGRIILIIEQYMLIVLRRPEYDHVWEINSRPTHL